MILLFVFGFICALQTLRLSISYNYLRKQNKNTSLKQNKEIFLIIPVLEEQAIINESVKNFSKLANEKVHIVYVTSAKEKKQRNIPTTLDLLRALKKKYPIEIIHCPLTKNAVMAHQINYAIKKIKQKQNDNFIIGVYNVDSQITPLTIQDIYINFEKTNNKDFVIQQYTIYPSKAGGVLSHIALWQNRWTLHFELGRVLVGMNPYFSHICKTFNYVIGHGLFFTDKIWEKIGGIPQDISNEDACMGLVLYAQNYQIYSIRHIEYALIAKNIKIYIKQQSVWFNGPFYAFLYAKKICKKYSSNFRFCLNCYIGSIKLFMHAIYWLFGPIFIWFIVPFYFYNNLQFLLIWYIIALYHCYLLNIITMYFVNKIKPNTIISAGNPIDAVIAYILHCVGPIYAIIKIIKGTNSLKDKYKTEK